MGIELEASSCGARVGVDFTSLLWWLRRVRIRLLLPFRFDSHIDEDVVAM